MSVYIYKYLYREFVYVHAVCIKRNFADVLNGDN